MKNITIATAAAAGFAAAFVGLAAPAIAAPSGGSAQQTINSLEAQGNRVIVNRESGAPLSQATVVSVREGNEIQKYVWDAQGDDRVLETVGRVVYVDVR